jgi:hypothetical protein
MTDRKPANQPDPCVTRSAAADSAPRERWDKPQIIDYQPLTIARGIAYRIGDGVSNLS